MYFRTISPNSLVGPIGSLSYPPREVGRRWAMGNTGNAPCAGCTGLGAPGALSGLGGVDAKTIGLGALGAVLGYVQPWGGMKRSTSTVVSGIIGLAIGML